MTSVPAARITDADVRALAAKLKGLHALLTPEEQALLHDVLQPAAGGKELDGTDAVGFAWAVSFNPFAYWCGYCRPADVCSAGEAGQRRREHMAVPV